MEKKRLGRGRPRRATRRIETLVEAAKKEHVPLADKAIRQDTVEQYRGRVVLMELFFTAMKFPIEEDSFVSFIEALAEVEGGGTSTAEGFRSAALHWQGRGAWPGDWTKSKKVSKAVDGFQYQGGQKRDQHSVRGTITKEMLALIVVKLRRGEGNWGSRKALTATQAGNIADTAEVQVLLALRITELMNILNGDWEDRGAKGKWIWLRRNKRFNRKTMKKVKVQGYWKRIHFVEVIKKLEHLAKGKKEGEEIFPSLKKGGAWNKLIYREALKRVMGPWAEEFGLKYDGSHVLRHAGVGMMLEDCEEKGLQDQKYLGQITVMNEKMRAWYGRSIEDRKEPEPGRKGKEHSTRGIEGEEVKIFKEGEIRKGKSSKEEKVKEKIGCKKKREQEDEEEQDAWMARMEKRLERLKRLL